MRELLWIGKAAARDLSATLNELLDEDRSIAVLKATFRIGDASAIDTLRRGADLQHTNRDEELRDIVVAEALWKHGDHGVANVLLPIAKVDTPDAERLRQLGIDQGDIAARRQATIDSLHSRYTRWRTMVAGKGRWRLEHCGAVVDALRAVQPGAIPDHLLERALSEGGATRAREGEFQVGEYFRVLPSVRLAPGYELSYVYRWSGDVGSPRLFLERHGQRVKVRWTAGVMCDGTPESFLELVLLELLGDNFYLYWHSAYRTIEPICEKSQLEKLPEEVASMARDIDVRPLVRIREDDVLVEVCVFNDWEGLWRRSYRIDRQPPRTIREGQRRLLVKYDCGGRM